MAYLKVAYFTYMINHPLSISSLTLVLKSASFLLPFLIVVILKASPFMLLVTLPFTHMARALSPYLGLHRVFRWIFLIADVKTPIIGSDFLSHHGLIVDVNKKQLLDNTTNLQVNALFSREAKLSLTPLPNSSNPLPSSDKTIIYDVSTKLPRPFVPKYFCRHIFHKLHSLSHPGIRATKQLISSHFVWPHMQKDIQQWSRSCLSCQRSNIQ